MSVALLTAIVFSLLVLLLLSGLPVAFSLGATALILILWYAGPESLFLIFATAFADWTNYVLLAIPLFVIMANLLAKSGIADDLYEMMYHWMGPLPGGLAMGTVIICAVFAAMSGISAAGTVTMGTVALPSMLKRNYDKMIALGSISAAGSLGILIPPSVMMVVFADLTGESVARLFAGGLFPGLLLVAIFIAYIAVRARIQPNIGPPIPREERLPLGRKLAMSRAVIAPAALIVVVLGAIYAGIATPTETAALGAVGALVIPVINRRFSWAMFRDASKGALVVTVMCGWIILGAKSFAHIYTTVGVPQFLSGLIGNMGVDRWLIMIVMQVILLILGCFVDALGIMMITIPVFVPIIQALGFDLLWFGILFVINMEIGFITPPFGLNLFYMQGVAPKGITLQDIYRSVWPFVALEILGLALVMVFPGIAVWFPRTVLGK